MASIAALYRLGWKNVQRWRMRLLVISLLIAGTLILYVLYNGLAISLVGSGVANIEPLNTRHYDMLLLLEEGQVPLPWDQFPPAPYDRQIVWYEEEVVSFSLSSEYGKLQAIAMGEEFSLLHSYSDDVVGQIPVAPEDIILPQSWATARELQLGDSIEVGYRRSDGLERWTAKVVGFYADDGKLPLAFVGYAHLKARLPELRTNALFFKIQKDKATLYHLSEWMDMVYPGAVQISSILPESLGAAMLRHMYQPEQGIMTLFFLFMGIGILTIALMIFLERRNEIAVLKSIGCDWRHIVGLLSFEYTVAGFLGTLLALGAYGLFLRQIPWVANLSFQHLGEMFLRGISLSVFVMALAMMYPLLLAKQASVSQLLFSRTIPLSVLYIDRLSQAPIDILNREVVDNVRIMRVPYELGKYDCMLMVHTGRKVKKGETIALQELYQGHQLIHYLAPCDGVVKELLGALVVIQPTNPNEPFQSYPARPSVSRELVARLREEDRVRRQRDAMHSRNG